MCVNKGSKELINEEVVIQTQANNIGIKVRKVVFVSVAQREKTASLDCLDTEESNKNY